MAAHCSDNAKRRSGADERTIMMRKALLIAVEDEPDPHRSSCCCDGSSSYSAAAAEARGGRPSFGRGTRIRKRRAALLQHNRNSRHRRSYSAFRFLELSVWFTLALLLFVLACCDGDSCSHCGVSSALLATTDPCRPLFYYNQQTTLRQQAGCRSPGHQQPHSPCAPVHFNNPTTHQSSFLLVSRSRPRTTTTLSLMSCSSERSQKASSCSQRRGRMRMWDEASDSTRIRTVRGGALWPSSSSKKAGARTAVAAHSSRSSSMLEAAAVAEEEQQSFPLEQRRKRGMTLALTASYFTVMGAKCALPTVLSLLTAPVKNGGLTFPTGASPQQQIAQQLTIATLAVALGKMLLGPVIDHFGGIRSLKLALGSLAALLLTISATQSFVTFACCWTLVDFIFSSCWAASIHAVHQSFDRSEWANQIGNLAAAARAGNSLAFISFALVLQVFEDRGMKQYWRPVFFTAALAQVVSVVLLALFGKQKEPHATTTTDVVVESRRRGLMTRLFPSQSDQTLNSGGESMATTTSPSFGASLSTLRREAGTLDFWLHLISRTVLMLYASFLMFVPTLMTQVYKTSASAGAQVGSLYALGCLLSVTTISKLYAKMPRRTKLWTVSLLLLLGATGSSVAQLGHVAARWTVSPAVSAFLMFLWGFSFAIPFYIPPSLYALAKGGNESSATIADVFDVGGFALLASFNGYVASIAHSNPSAWIRTFQITTLCSIVSFMALSLAIWREKDEA